MVKTTLGLACLIASTWAPAQSSSLPIQNGSLPAQSAGDSDQGATDQGAFIMTIGADTFGVETFDRSAERIEGEIIGQQIGRLQYSAALAPNALVTRWKMSAWPAGSTTDTPPAQIAEITFHGDSVTAELEMGGATQTQRFRTEPDALPSYPTSIVLLEQIVRRARVIDPAAETIEIPLFFLAGGQTASATLRRLGGGSIAIVVMSSEVRLQVDGEDRVIGGTIPAQNLTIHRVSREVGEEALSAAATPAPPPDYSAPPGAPYTAEEVVVPVPVASVGGVARSLELSGLIQNSRDGEVTTLTDDARRADDASRADGASRADDASRADGTTAVAHTLAGTLTIPKERIGPVPAVVTLTGSGAQRRDEDVLPGYAPFREVADALGRNGIAVLRLDDRGTGSSTGDFASATTTDFADDARAALDYLRRRPEIDPARLVLLGHSEGGLIAPMIAATDQSLAAIVLLAAPAQSGREIITYQQRYAIDATMIRDPAEREAALAQAAEQLHQQAATSPWLRFFLDYDPLPTAALVRQPVLILQGETDRQVTADQAEQLAEVIRAGGNDDVLVHLIPEANHLFVDDPIGDPTRYSTLPSLEVVPEVLDTITNWLEERLISSLPSASPHGST